jgi:hypothetical protein
VRPFVAALVLTAAAGLLGAGVMLAGVYVAIGMA